MTPLPSSRDSALYALTVAWLHLKLFGVSPLAMIAT